MIFGPLGRICARKKVRASIRFRSIFMPKKDVHLGRILQAGLLPNLIKDELDAEGIVEAGVAAGVRAFEVSCRRPDTVQILQRLRSRFPEVSFGVSSLIEEGPYFRFLQQRGPRFPSIDEAVEAGADFLVSVITFSSETYRRYPHLPIIPGVESADEAKRQLDLGASLVKFLNIGVAALKATNGGPIHFGLPLLVTGGVRPANVPDLVSAGTLVCVSDFDLILQDQYQAMQKRLDAQVVRTCIGEYVAQFAESRRKYRPNVDFASADPVKIQRESGQFMNVTAET